MGAGFDEELLDRLDPGWREWLELREEAGSTNDVAAELALAGVRHGTVVVANRQGSGRGRKGAEWVCPPGAGLAFSVVLRPRLARMYWPRLSLVAGLAVATEIECLGVEARVKWPNDVLIGGRKVCGVLVEASEEYAVVGVGVNVTVGRFPPELAEIATSLHSEARRDLSREPLLVGIRAALLHLVEEAVDGFAGVLAALSERSALHGETVRARTPRGDVVGKVLGFGAGGELMIESDGEIRELVQADEIRVVGRD